MRRWQLILAVLILIPVCYLVYVFFFPRPKRVEYIRITIAQLKSKVDSLVAHKDTSTQYYEIPGYYSNGTLPILVSDFRLLRKNSILPDTSFLILSGAGEDSVTATEKSKGARLDTFLAGHPLPETKYEGAYVSTRIIVRVTPKVFSMANNIGNRKKSFLSDTTLVKLTVADKPEITAKATRLYSFLNKQVKLLRTGTLWPKTRKNGLVAPDPNKYALLYCGGFDTVNNDERYWNDLTFMYNTLVKRCAFAPKNIFVVYATGKGFQGRKDIPVDYPATATAFRSAISILQREMTGKSTFFTFITNHGGGYDRIGNSPDHGRFDENHDEAVQDLQKWDEEIFFYNQPVNDLWDDSLTVLFSGLRYNKMVVLLEPCYGGGLIHDLRGPNRLIFSACGEYESSYGDISPDHPDYDTFCYYFTAALAGRTADNISVSADLNDDKKVSLLEAFLYAKKMDSETEHPEMDDSGDGIGTPTPDAKAIHGRLSATTFLN